MDREGSLSCGEAEGCYPEASLPRAARLLIPYVQLQPESVASAAWARARLGDGLCVPRRDSDDVGAGCSRR